MCVESAGRIAVVWWFHGYRMHLHNQVLSGMCKISLSLSLSLSFSLSSLSHFYQRNLAEFVLERENKKHQLAQIETDIFKRRYQLEDWSGSIMACLRPVSTHSDTTVRHPSSSVGDGWEGKHSLVKVSVVNGLIR